VRRGDQLVERGQGRVDVAEGRQLACGVAHLGLACPYSAPRPGRASRRTPRTFLQRLRTSWTVSCRPSAPARRGPPGPWPLAPDQAADVRADRGVGRMR
jgi:hypothetical protein